jgi:hypothetical protein
MLSWIFRHRQRLTAIYGMVQVPALPGSRQWEKQAPPAGGSPRFVFRAGRSAILAAVEHADHVRLLRGGVPGHPAEQLLPRETCGARDGHARARRPGFGGRPWGPCGRCDRCEMTLGENGTIHQEV